MTIAIYHNPDCGTSRNTIAIVRASGVEPAIIEYLQVGWTRGQLIGLFAAAGVTPPEALRVSGSPAEDMGLTDPTVDDETLLTAMVAHPILVNRPIVCAPKGVRLCRPSERILELLDNPDAVAGFIKEDGTPLV